MKMLILLIITLSIFSNCQQFNNHRIVKNGPYEEFFDKLNSGKITDTIIVQAQTRVFGCGTAYLEYSKKLNKSGLDKFYNKYSDVLSDTISIAKFEKKFKTKILWLTRGNEGEKLELLDSTLHNKINFKKLLATKNFIKFSENPISMNVVKIYYSIAYPIEKKYFSKEYKVFKTNKNWKSIKVSTDKSEIVDFEYAYYPS